MIEENIRFLKDMVGNRRDLYSILSFLSETIDTMRTDLAVQDRMPSMHI